MLVSFNSPDNMLGVKRSGLRALINCGLLLYTTPLIDRVGKETRPSVKGKYILGNGTLTANLGLNNTSITYLDADTMNDVSETTSAAGLFTFPNNVKVANIKIPSTGDVFHLQEGSGNTIADSVNGRVAKLSASVTFVDLNTLPSQADLVGYTLSDGSTYYWDESTTDLIPSNVIIPNLSNIESVAFVVVAVPWILEGGIWNDNGQWRDDATWID